VTAGMSQNDGAFPFGTSDVRDNDAIGHLRNYSNYLLPRAHSIGRNLLEVTAVLLRGLLANAILVLVFLLGAALLTKAAYPEWNDLLLANFLPKLVAVLTEIPKYLADMRLPTSAASLVNTVYASIGHGSAGSRHGRVHGSPITPPQNHFLPRLWSRRSWPVLSSSGRSRGRPRTTSRMTWTADI
jgi:hypothetical protein